jgi:hypothetical protein
MLLHPAFAIWINGQLHQRYLMGTSTKIFVPIENLTRSAGIFKDLLRTTQPMELFLMLILNQDGFGIY